MEKNIQDAVNEAVEAGGGVADDITGQTMVESSVKSESQSETTKEDEIKKTTESGEKTPESSSEEAKPEASEQVSNKDRAKKQFEKLLASNRRLKEELAKKEEATRQQHIARDTTPVDTTLTQEDKMLVERLKGLMGVDSAMGDLQNIKSTLGELTRITRDKQYDEEEKDLIGLIDAVGLPPDSSYDEVIDELDESIKTDPVLSRLVERNGVIPPGVRRLAFKTFNVDQLGQMSEQKVRKQLLEENEKRKKGATESKSAGASKPAVKSTGNIYQDTARAIDAAGGYDNIQW